MIDHLTQGTAAVAGKDQSHRARFGCTESVLYQAGRWYHRPVAMFTIVVVTSDMVGRPQASCLPCARISRLAQTRMAAWKQFSTRHATLS